MKKLVLIISILLSINVLTAQSRIHVDLEPFTVVDINFVGDVVIKQCATSNEVNIKANDYKFIENTHVVVSDGKLSIYMDKSSSREKKDKIQMEIHLPRLEKLTLLGAGDVMVEKRDEPNLTVINAGAGECTLQCLKIEGSLELHNKGAGDIKVSSPDPIRTDPAHQQLRRRWRVHFGEPRQQFINRQQYGSWRRFGEPDEHPHR